MFATNVAQTLWSQGTAAFSFLSLMLVTPLVFFYALVDWPKMLAKIDSWLPRQNAPQIRALASDIDSRVSAFIRGQGTVCLVLAAFYALALSAVGLRYGLLIGLLTGLLSFIPFAETTIIPHLSAFSLSASRMGWSLPNGRARFVEISRSSRYSTWSLPSPRSAAILRI